MTSNLISNASLPKGSLGYRLRSSRNNCRGPRSQLGEWGRASTLLFLARLFRHVSRGDPPAARRTDPGLALAANTGFCSFHRLGIGRGKVAAEGGDHGIP